MAPTWLEGYELPAIDSFIRFLGRNVLFVNGGWGRVENEGFFSSLRLSSNSLDSIGVMVGFELGTKEFTQLDVLNREEEIQ